jgi:hypothetical protein
MNRKVLINNFIQELKQAVKPHFIKIADVEGVEGIIFEAGKYVVELLPFFDKNEEFGFIDILHIKEFKNEENPKIVTELIIHPYLSFSKNDYSVTIYGLNIDYILYLKGGWESLTYRTRRLPSKFIKEKKFLHILNILTNKQILFEFLQALTQNKITLKEIFKPIISSF